MDGVCNRYYRGEQQQQHILALGHQDDQDNCLMTACKPPGSTALPGQLC